MTTLQQQVRSTLGTVAGLGDRVSYGTNMLQPVAYPYAVFLFVSSVANLNLSGPSDMQNARLQVDIYSRDAAEARALLAQATAALLAAFTVGAITTQDFPPDPDTRSYRASADFSVWSATA